jgi:hypothetical protein
MRGIDWTSRPTGCFLPILQSNVLNLDSGVFVLPSYIQSTTSPLYSCNKRCSWAFMLPSDEDLCSRFSKQPDVGRNSVFLEQDIWTHSGLKTHHEDHHPALQGSTPWLSCNLMQVYACYHTLWSYLMDLALLIFCWTVSLRVKNRKTFSPSQGTEFATYTWRRVFPRHTRSSWGKRANLFFG